MDEKLRILLCEDDENLGTLTREYLEDKGYKAELFADGESGYRAFLKGKFDICLLDVMMPKKDGFQLAQEIRTVNRDVPILFLTAKADEKSDFITVTVVAKTIPVTGISLDKPSITVTVDESEQLTATVTPADATNKNVIWSSSDTKVATVEDGKVAGVAPGTATVIARTEDGGKTAECAVTVEAKVPPSVTVGSDHVSAVSAVLYGKANIKSTTSSDLEVGFQYSTSQGILPSNSVKVKAADADADYNYLSGITGLEPGKTYYYRSYISQKGQDTYGETMSFTTKALSSMLATRSATEVEPKSALLNAMLDLTDVQYASMEYGFCWGTSSGSQNNIVSCGSIVKNAYSAPLPSLSERKRLLQEGSLLVQELCETRQPDFLRRRCLLHDRHRQRAKRYA